MSTQDNLANQAKVVVNGKHCVDTEKSLCTQGNWCVNTTLCTPMCTDLQAPELKYSCSSEEHKLHNCLR